MKNDIVHIELCYRLLGVHIIKKHLESVIWYGSASKGQDIHPRSDCDMQIILNEPSYDATIELNVILEDYPYVDLSIVYLKDIYDKNGQVVFQNGTKGLFFIHVLAQGKVLYGKNIYKNIADRLGLSEIKPSLVFTIREYLSRLRIMATHNPNDTLRFKKYSLKLLKDILIYKGVISLDEISQVTYEDTYKKTKNSFNFDSKTNLIFSKITDFSSNFTKEDMATLLSNYESIVHSSIYE
jgi:hypothetical protein